MTCYRAYTVTYSAGKAVRLSTYTMPHGKLEQFLVEIPN